MVKEKLKNLFAVSAAALVMASSMTSYASSTTTITDESADSTAEVSVTATVVSDFTVTLPMSIELEETEEVGDYGPIFASPTYSYDSSTSTASGTYIGVSGTLYGKYLQITVNDTRENSPYNADGYENMLALGQATYDSDTATYTVADETTDVYADVNLDYHLFYPASETTLPDDATNIISSDSSASAYNYPLNIVTNSKVTADGTTLYYGQITFTIEAVEY